MKTLTLINLAVAVAATSLTAIPTSAFAAPKQDNMKMEKMMMAMTSGKFAGIEVNGGTVTLSKEMGKNVLRLSKDFMIPKTPSPWSCPSEVHQERKERTDLVLLRRSQSWRSQVR